MTKLELTEILTYVGVAVQKSIDAYGITVYFDLLGDLNAEDLRNGAKLVLLEHRWKTFPTVAELREAAFRASKSEVVDDAPEIAWAQAWRAIGRIDVEQDGSADRALNGLPEDAVLTIRSLGVTNLTAGTEPISVVRAQFLKAYNGIRAAREKRAKLPAKLVEAIERRPPAISATLAAIGNGGRPG